MAHDGAGLNSNIVAFVVAVVVFALVFVPVSWFFGALIIAPAILLVISAWLSYSTHAHEGRRKARRE